MGFDRGNPFQPQTAEHRDPPFYDLLFPRRTCYADRGSPIMRMRELNPQSSKEDLTQIITDVVATETQMFGFFKNGEVELCKSFNEVNRIQRRVIFQLYS